MAAGTRFLLFVAAFFLGLQGTAAQLPPGVFPDTKWVEIHGWLMWASMGVLFPWGAILIRNSRSLRDPNGPQNKSRGKLFFYLHIVVQVLAVLAATAGISVLINRIGPVFDYTHTRLGLALWILALLQPFIGILRPHKGKPARPIWFLIHWTFGTAIIFLGIINIYLGFTFYEFLTAKSLRSLNIAFSVQVAVMALVYLLQDKVSYILGQSDTQRGYPKTRPAHDTNGGTVSNL